MENRHLDRLTLFCKQTWVLLTAEEQERYYYDTGVIGFVEDCMLILNVAPNKFTVVEVDLLASELLRLAK